MSALSLHDLANDLKVHLERKDFMLVTAESCTGGLIASKMTRLPGSSGVFERGYVTYSNEAKHENLGVRVSVLEEYGAVSAETAEAMALGALEHSQADIAISVTGVAGPDGGTDEKPVGLVYIGIVAHGMDGLVIENHFKGDRHAVQDQTVEKALEAAIEYLL